MCGLYHYNNRSYAINSGIFEMRILSELSVHPSPPRETCAKYDERKKSTRHEREVGPTGFKGQNGILRTKYNEATK